MNKAGSCLLKLCFIRIVIYKLIIKLERCSCLLVVMFLSFVLILNIKIEASIATLIFLQHCRASMMVYDSLTRSSYFGLCTSSKF